MFQVEICCQQLEICKSCACLPSSPLLWRLINFRLFCSDDCRSWPREEKFWSDDCRSWPREENINNHGCWSKHAYIPDNDYWGICLFHVVWTTFCFAIILLWYTRNIISSPGHRPCELLSWVSVRPSVSFSYLTLLLCNRWTDFNQTCHKCSLDGPLPDLCFLV
jgi:hypothetical protein